MQTCRGKMIYPFAGKNGLLKHCDKLQKEVDAILKIPQSMRKESVVGQQQYGTNAIVNNEMLLTKIIEYRLYR